MSRFQSGFSNWKPKPTIKPTERQLAAAMRTAARIGGEVPEEARESFAAMRIYLNDNYVDYQDTEQQKQYLDGTHSTLQSDENIFANELEEASNFFANNIPTGQAKSDVEKKAEQQEKPEIVEVERISKYFTQDSNFNNKEPRNFFEHTTHGNSRNNANILQSFPPRFSDKTTSEIMREFAQHGNDPLAKRYVLSAMDCAYLNMDGLHKYEISKSSPDTIHEITARHELEKEMFIYKEKDFKGQNAGTEELKKAFETYADIRSEQAIELAKERKKNDLEAEKNSIKEPTKEDLVAKMQESLIYHQSTHDATNRVIAKNDKAQVLSRIQSMREKFK